MVGVHDLRRTDIGSSYANDADVARTRIQERMEKKGDGPITVPAGVQQLFRYAATGQELPQHRPTHAGLAADIHYHLVVDTYRRMGVDSAEVPSRLEAAQRVLAGEDTKPENLRELSDFFAELALSSHARKGTPSPYTYFR